jgi:hypothetical protein
MVLRLFVFVLFLLPVVFTDGAAHRVPGTKAERNDWVRISHYLFEQGEYHSHNEDSMYMHVGTVRRLHERVRDEVVAFVHGNHTHLPVGSKEYMMLAREVPWLNIIINAVTQSRRVKFRESVYDKAFPAPVPMRSEVARMFTDHFLQALVRLHHREIQCRRQSGLTLPTRRQTEACASKVLFRTPSSLAGEMADAVEAGVKSDEYLLWAYDQNPPRV